MIGPISQLPGISSELVDTRRLSEPKALSPYVPDFQYSSALTFGHSSSPHSFLQATH